MLFVIDFLSIWQVVPGKVSFTFDAWTSQVGDPYLSITGHFIHGTGAAWKLHSEQLAFSPLPGRHSGCQHWRLTGMVCGERYADLSICK